MVVMTWVTGEDRWTPVGPLWDGKTTRQAPSDPKAGPSIQQPSPSGAAGPAAGDESAGISTTTVIFRGPYSEEEELAMSQFAQSVRDRGEKVSYRSWQEFAETVRTGQQLNRLWLNRCSIRTANLGRGHSSTTCTRRALMLSPALAKVVPLR